MGVAAVFMQSNTFNFAQHAPPTPRTGLGPLEPVELLGGAYISEGRYCKDIGDPAHTTRLTIIQAH